jgi:hypothetical protein
MTTFRSVLEPVFLPDAEIAKLMRMTGPEWEAAATVLERSGLPRRDPLFKNQRCWPRVRDFLYRRAGGPLPDDTEMTGIVENLDALRTTGKRRARS